MRYQAALRPDAAPRRPAHATKRLLPLQFPLQSRGPRSRSSGGELFRPTEPSQQRDEAAGLESLPDLLAAAPRHTDENLRASIGSLGQRKDQTSPFVQLVQQRLGNARDGGGDEDFPAARPGMDPAKWRSALEESYRRFGRDVDAGRPSFIDPYAAEHPAEFFAVMSEAFFTESAVLARDWPELYEQLALFYRQDPAGRAEA